MVRPLARKNNTKTCSMTAETSRIRISTRIWVARIWMKIFCMSIFSAGLVELFANVWRKPCFIEVSPYLQQVRNWRPHGTFQKLPPKWQFLESHCAHAPGALLEPAPKSNQLRGPHWSHVGHRPPSGARIDCGLKALLSSPDMMMMMMMMMFEGWVGPEIKDLVTRCMRVLLLLHCWQAKRIEKAFHPVIFVCHNLYI